MELRSHRRGGVVLLGVVGPSLFGVALMFVIRLSDTLLISPTPNNVTEDPKPEAPKRLVGRPRQERPKSASALRVRLYRMRRGIGRPWAPEDLPPPKVVS